MKENGPFLVALAAVLAVGAAIGILAFPTNGGGAAPATANEAAPLSGTGSAPAPTPAPNSGAPAPSAADEVPEQPDQPAPPPPSSPATEGTGNQNEFPAIT